MSSQRQFLAFAVLALGVFGATGLLAADQEHLFQAYFGSLDPFVAVGLVTAVGAFSLGVLNARYAFKIIRPEAYPLGPLRAASIATLFVAPVILVDVTLGYPREINVSLPHAFLFYPIMGYVAEIVLYVFPFCLMLFVLKRLLANAGTNTVIWSCIFHTSLLESVFQFAFAVARYDFSPVNAYTSVHVFVFGIVQMYFFWRYDFMTMYVFRMAYYLLWHMLWSQMRLELLF